MSNVKLAIRLRPFSDRELKSEKENISVVSVEDDHTVTITNVKVSTSGAGDSRERVRRYFSDYTYDSACDADSPRHAAQDKVFNTLGVDVLACLSRGTSVCVMAYGQSATGKTHTMMGTPTQPGLVPRLCSELVTLLKCEVTVSFLEIYNERVHDLLVGDERVADYNSLPRRRGNTRKDLRVREHPTRGPYVQNLRRVAVHDAEALLALVSEGARRRRTASTRRNPASSRSHALLELSTPHCTLHLADLAGRLIYDRAGIVRSEKASWDGCGSGAGGRQKEGANINKSLVALSNVISALVSSGCGRGRFVPYRDSALTWLLKDCFTGGAAAFIIATVSPSIACYGESASTLRWASRAKQLRTPPPLQPSTVLTTRAALHAQLQHIINELNIHHIQYIPESGTLLFKDQHWNLNKSAEKDILRENNSIFGNNMESINVKLSDIQKSESTTSSIASGSSDHIIGIDKNVKLSNEISKEVDKFFGPSLERTRSGSDLKIRAPLRNKRRQYRSQEVLPVTNKNILVNQVDSSDKNVSVRETEKEIEFSNTANESNKKTLSNVPIVYDNSQRAEIVASVTERLYNKLKKKEESAISKVENVVDKKIMEPLSELKICTNARQKLVELSQKALRNKRRIGIPAHTQTRARVTRVRDQGTDIQFDLEPYAIKEKNNIVFYQSVGTETNSMIPRCKDVSTGPQCGSLVHQDNWTITDSRRIPQINCSVMTERLVQYDRCTQTDIVPPPRKKKNRKHCTKDLNIFNIREKTEPSISPSISINITQSYPVDQESTSTSEESLDETVSNTKNVTATPDLLTNHSSVETKVFGEEHYNGPIKEVEINCIREMENQFNLCSSQQNQKKHHVMAPNEQTHTYDDERTSSEDVFSDVEEYKLPRVTVDMSTTCDHKGIKDMILGRTENLYPYNIILSPPRVKEENVRKIVKFKDLDSTVPVVASQTSLDLENSALYHQNTDIETESSKSDSTVNSTNSSNVSKCTDTFIWKTISNKNNVNNNINNDKNVYQPVYKTNLTRYNTERTKLYKEFLGLKSDLDMDSKKNICSHEKSEKTDKYTYDSNTDTDCDHTLKDFRQKRDYFENKVDNIFNQTKDPFYDFERKLLQSCDRLDESVNKYDKYLRKYQQRNQQHFSPKLNNNANNPKPKEYLQHLVELRKNLVREENRKNSFSSDC